MTLLNKLISLPILSIYLFFTSFAKQGKTNFPTQNSLTPTIQQTFLQTQNQTPVGNVGTSFQDRKGNLWFATTGNGLYRYDGKSFTNFSIKNGLSSDFVSSIVEDKKGDLWLGSDAGITHYDGKTFTNIPAPDNFVTSVLMDKSGKLWVATRKGVYWYDGKVFTPFLDDQKISNPNGLALRVVQDLLEDQHGTIWITTKDEGICRYDSKSIVNYTPYNQTWFRGLFEDRDGNIWAGGKNTGLCRFDGKGFSRVLANGKLDTYNIYSIIQDESGKLWLGTEADDSSTRDVDGGVWVYDGKSFTNYTRQNGLSHNAVWCILEDRGGKFWFGTRRGLSRYDGKSFEILGR